MCINNSLVLAICLPLLVDFSLSCMNYVQQKIMTTIIEMEVPTSILRISYAKVRGCKLFFHEVLDNLRKP